MADQTLASRLADEIVRSELAGVAALFEEQGAPAPTLIWDPAPDRLRAEPLRVLHAYWDRLRGDRPMPLAADVNAVEMKRALGYVMLLDVLEGGADYRYRVYGSAIAERSGFDMTGKLTSEVPASKHIAEFFLAVYRAVIARKLPIYTAHTPPSQIEVAIWHRLSLPLADEAGTVCRLLVGNVPGRWRPAG